MRARRTLDRVAAARRPRVERTDRARRCRPSVPLAPRREPDRPPRTGPGRAAPERRVDRGGRRPSKLAVARRRHNGRSGTATHQRPHTRGRNGGGAGPDPAHAPAGRFRPDRLPLRRALRRGGGWDAGFEAPVAEIAAASPRGVDPVRERCWIAERRGVPLGSVILVRGRRGGQTAFATGGAASARPKPRARVAGTGAAGPRALGHRRLTSWADPCPPAARGLPVRAGFRPVSPEPHRGFGHDLVGEAWELAPDAGVPLAHRVKAARMARFR